MAARHIAAAVGSALQRLALAGLKRLDFDVAVIVPAGIGAGHEEDCLATRQHLRIAMCPVASAGVQFGQRLRGAAGGWNARKPSGVSQGGDDVAVVSPTGSAHAGALIAQSDGAAPLYGK